MERLKTFQLSIFNSVSFETKKAFLSNNPKKRLIEMQLFIFMLMPVSNLQSDHQRAQHLRSSEASCLQHLLFLFLLSE